MRRVPRTILGAVAIVVVLVVGGATAKVAAATRAYDVLNDPTPFLNVTGTGSYSFNPGGVQNVPIHSNISVIFTDGDPSGALHTFTILGCPDLQISDPASVSPGTLNDYAYGSKCPKYLVNINATGPGNFVGNFTSPTNASWFEYVCTESGHFALGMYGFIAFGMALPANISFGIPSTGPGTAVFIIVGTIVALTVIALVLGFIVGKREGARHEMPPERLGYPEPGAPPARPPEHAP